MSIARATSIGIGSTWLPTPVFFPSISSVKTILSPSEYIAVLYSLRELNAQFLVSAFDIYQSQDGLAELLNHAQLSGVTVLMDSGNYESFWKGAHSTWQQKDFHAVLQRFSSTLAFSFDEQNPPLDHVAHAKHVVEHYRQDQSAAGANRPIIPIIHGDRERLAETCVYIAETTNVPMLAVAERRLGDDVLERAKSVQAIRAALDATGRYVGLHLLGTGNPISIAVYSWAGADSFDGLEWCQTVVDHETGLLYHYSQANFFHQQTAWGDMDISFHSKTLAHNLTFYSDWMQRLRQAILTGDELNFFRFNLPNRVFRQCSSAFEWGTAK